MFLFIKHEKWDRRFVFIITTQILLHMPIKESIVFVNVYYVISFRPNYFTCIAHLYLYYTLLVLHIYSFYIRYRCIFFHQKIQYNLSVFLTWYQSHRSNFFLAVLSSLVLFQTHNCFCLYNYCCSHSPLNLWCISVIISDFGLAVAVIQSLETTAILSLPWSLLRLCFCRYH